MAGTTPSPRALSRAIKEVAAQAADRRKQALPSMRDLGMYADASTGVQVGKFNIRRQSADKVWIERDDGEGAEFSDDLFEAAVREFYRKYF